MVVLEDVEDVVVRPEEDAVASRRADVEEAASEDVAVELVDAVDAVDSLPEVDPVDVVVLLLGVVVVSLLGDGKCFICLISNWGKILWSMESGCIIRGLVEKLRFFFVTTCQRLYVSFEAWSFVKFASLDFVFVKDLIE